METSQGFSVTYNQRLLYSKYNPAKNILSIIERTQILPGTIILCISPILQYGLEELGSILPENCLMFGIEADKELQALANTQTENLSIRKNGTYTLLATQELMDFPQKLGILAETGCYRRVISIDFSGGASLNPDFYNEFFEACRNAISQFWKNRITIVKFGRKYNLNLFRNLKNNTSRLKGLSISRPIIVAGAGESATQTFNKIKGKEKDFFIIAVDALLPALKSMNIKPDAVVCEEAQTIISRAFIGSRKNYDYLFVSSTSTPSVTKLTPEKNIFYTPEFCNGKYLSSMIQKGILKNPQRPLGSVGLSAVEIALKSRSSSSVPVYITGLDFSYSIGQTHAKMSLHEKTRRCASNKLHSFENFASAFGNDSKTITGKNGEKVITTTALYGYSQLFNYKFQDTDNLFDIGSTGIPLAIRRKEEPECRSGENSDSVREIFGDESREAVEEFLTKEKEALHELKELFTSKKDLSQEERTKKITVLLENREYLYIHFPDGYRLSLSQDFLNRIRIEIDHFLRNL